MGDKIVSEQLRKVNNEMRDWKWYDRMQEIMSDGTTETYTDFDGKSRGSNSRSPTPASAQAQALNGKKI